MVCAVDQNLEMQVRAGRVALVADCRDLIAGHYALTDLHSPGVDVAVEGHRSVGVAQLYPRP